MASLSRVEFLRAARALSARYVETRRTLPDRSPLDSAGKRAAFALLFGPIHFAAVAGVVDALDNCPARANDDQQDTDGDDVGEVCDDCTLVANADQRDTDGDGYGNICDADFDEDGFIDVADLGYMKARFFSTDPDADLNGDGFVNFRDLGLLKGMFLGPPGPSGVRPTP